jgi:hypothetical protein
MPFGQPVTQPSLQPAQALHIETSLRVVGDPIGSHRGVAAVAQPERPGTGVLEEIQHHPLVIAEQADGFEAGRQGIQQPVDDPGGIRTAIDIVPEMNEHPA